MSPQSRRDLLRVFRWDLTYILRDKAALFFMFVLPLVLYPLIMWGSMKSASSKEKSSRAKVLKVAGDAGLDDLLRPTDKLKRVQGELQATGDTEVLAEVTLSKDGEPALIRYRSDKSQSRRARKRLKKVLRRAQDAERSDKFAQAGLHIDPDEVLQTVVKDASTAADRAGTGLGKFIPLVLVFLAMGGGLHTALDLFTGERERGTLETLLTSRVSRSAVVGAKFLLVLISTLLTSLIALTSLGLCIGQGWFELPDTQVSQLSISAVLWIAVLAIPLVIQLSSALVVLAISVPDFKTGQFIVAPAMILAMLPASVSMMPGVSLSPLLALVPITNVALTTQEVMLSSPRWGLVFLAIGISMLHTGVLIWGGLRIIGKESAVFGTMGRVARHARGQFGVEATVLFAIALLLFWFIGQSSMHWDLSRGIIITQLLCVALPAVLMVRWLGLPVMERLQFRRPALTDLGLGIVAGTLAPCLSMLVADAQSGLIPVSTKTLEQLDQMLPMDQPLWVLICLIAILPGLCEEVLFRGAILGLLRKSVGPTARCIIVAVLFGLLHLSLMRIMPTATLGLLLTAAALRTRSIWVPIAMHVINNGLVITLASLELVGPDSLGVGLQLTGAALAIGAVALMGRRRD